MLNPSKQTPATVVVGMSGGVDSSVSALLLKEQGYHVIGLFMKNWEEEDGQGRCLASEDYEDVLAVCHALEIPCYTSNFSEKYWELVFTEFLQGLQMGITPNPDILCNREIKFKALYERAKELGGDYLATGHYCQISSIEEKWRLMKGADRNKDQTYFLYTLKEEMLPSLLFPVGHLPKERVRQIALQHHLSNAKKKDSTGICFIGKRNFRQFLSQHLPTTPGHFETLEGKIVGEHMGIAYYTLGQRKGLRIGGEGEAWFVVGKDLARNVIHVAQGSDHPALYSDELLAKEMSWITSEEARKLPLYCRCKIRYRQEEQECFIQQTQEGALHVSFLLPQRAVTPGQAIVFYQGEICLGGGMIVEARKNPQARSYFR